jgi:hypothetical protein
MLPAGIRHMAGCQLITMPDASGALRPGRVGHSDPQRPSTSTGSIWRPISRTTGGAGVCPLDRAVGVTQRSSLRYLKIQEARLVVPVPQHTAPKHQTAMYETYN